MTYRFHTHFPLLILATAAALPLAAQTHTAPHHAATTAHRTAAGGCVTTPELSAKIPALPNTAPCARTLYTVTQIPGVKLDYASPLLSPAVRDELGDGAKTFSLDYVETKPGSGPPVAEHQCLSVQYTGYLPDGTKFDSSHDHPGGEPISFLYGSHHVIAGWDTGFEGMHIGGQRRLFIPYELAYGETGKGPIPPKSELVFDVEPVSQTAPHVGAPPGAECMPERQPNHEAMPGRPGAPPPGTTQPHQ
ncbi:MAG TPA: FKBP-type peptidyl-prolyl cis-trans isomerase [Acidobacteriaceae bacterium]|jgi:peptidylprolyl isomerase|nr:FKBP-type peptidyl-prolyl cis-trans isomerase [Acidobacteriaceae bacterium]